MGRYTNFHAFFIKCTILTDSRCTNIFSGLFKVLSVLSEISSVQLVVVVLSKRGLAVNGLDCRLAPGFT